MFDVLADRTEIASPAQGYADAVLCDHDYDVTSSPFRSIRVLLIDTEDMGGFPVTEHCLRYMSKFECWITRAGSRSAAAFALTADDFDVVLSDQHCLDLVADASSPVIVVAERTAQVARQARSVGASHCLAFDDLSPRLLEVAIGDVLRGATVMT
jgi:hypothetical protein